MPLKESKEFTKIAEALNTLADGVKAHCKETDFPSVLKETEIRKEQTVLEDSREAYEKAQIIADKKSAEYNALLKAGETKLATAQRLLQGFYGLRSITLKDFGFQPPKPGGRKGKHEPKE